MSVEERGSPLAPPLALIDLGAALLAGALWYVRPELGPAPLLLLAIGFAVRHLSDPPVEYELTALDAAMALFLLSAGIGLLIAYDWNVALEKFYVIVGGVGIYGALVRAPAEVSLGGRTVKPINLLLAVLPAAIALYYVATADYSLQIGKLPFLDGLFNWISSWQPALPGHKLHPNVAGGLIAGLLPLQVLVLAEMAGARRRRPRSAARGAPTLLEWAERDRAAKPHRPRYRLGWRVVGIETVLVAISALGLILSASRGAWAALGAVALACAAARGLRLGRPRGPRGAVAAGVTGLVVVMALAWAPGALAGQAASFDYGLTPSAQDAQPAMARPSTTLRSAQDASTALRSAQNAHQDAQPATARPSTTLRSAQDASTALRSASFDSAPAGRAMLASRAQDAQQVQAASASLSQRAAQDAQGAAEGRAGLLGDSLALAWDTAFTGLGLGGFQMAFSSYVLLLHVGHTFHSHNLFLNVWLEQGLLGLASFAWLLAAAVVAWWRVRRLGDARGKAWAGAALAALAVIALHGLVDDAFYGSRGVLLLFVPFALLTRAQADAVWEAYEPPTLTQVLMSRNGFIAAGILAAALLIGLTPPVRSQFQASLGALAQTRAELSVYEWPTWPIQDALRRAPEINLDPAIVHYRTALAIDPNNATASRRLGQIALSRGDYPTAESLLSHCISQWLHESSSAATLWGDPGDRGAHRGGRGGVADGGFVAGAARCAGVVVWEHRGDGDEIEDGRWKKED